ncbi:hypothetical protein BKH41_04835 [Helicobacter sp. 12S02232-10]|uniref:hypothetical protein n=1 Tax=Helicobacter sp. 12S02232-10 TaxID=1476197 RepID=UPI000BA54B8A|nr:hypothetical protein [Helicobacter sp. 12S02232-10]PAF48956.1 hypothetical protein BKH41_04835 [Helicobacter sp. 12S02232-10]
MRKIALGSVCLFILWGNFVKALEVTVDPFGYLGVLYNQGIQSSPHSYIGLNARAGANFILDNNWSLGLGAIGAWSVFSHKDDNAPYSNSGDISDAYVKYDTERLKFALGRYNTDFLEFDWMAGNVQGASIRINDRKMNYWGIFMDSMLYNGYQYSGQQGNRIATDLNSLSAYNPGAKKNYVGGEVIAGGVDYTYKGFRISPFVLIDTQLPTITKGVLVQVGAKAGYATVIADAFKSVTLLRGMFQYGDTDGLAGDDLAGLIWIDQTFKYKLFNFGAGFYAVPGADKKGSLWTFNDRTKFYGRGINSPGVPAVYFANATVAGYLFGGLETNRVRVDAMVAFGNYQEYSLMADYKIWQHRNMKFNAGGGYVYSYSSKVLNSIGDSSLVFFGKFSY